MTPQGIVLNFLHNLCEFFTQGLVTSHRSLSQIHKMNWPQWTGSVVNGLHMGGPNSEYLFLTQVKHKWTFFFGRVGKISALHNHNQFFLS